MPYYLYQVAYTPEAWADLAKKPQDRARAIRPILKEFKGRLVDFYLAFGDYDIVAIAEMPDNESAAGFSIAASAGGALKAIKTTPLMTVQEGMRAMRKAGRSRYRPPS
ncbi:MAG: GYD domain-containing protein [Dehalococcoidia bacterium]|nr:GYD domain-containing protein [Dehalococcoidia bacterium]